MNEERMARSLAWSGRSEPSLRTRSVPAQPTESMAPYLRPYSVTHKKGDFAASIIIIIIIIIISY